MQVDLFDFILPKELIARTPHEPRDHAKLLDLTNTHPHDRIIADLLHCLRPGDLIVANNTKTLACRFYLSIGQGKIEIVLIKFHTTSSNPICEALARPSKKLSKHDIVAFNHTISATVTNKEPYGRITLHFNCSWQELYIMMEQQGQMALPPYIGKRTLEQAKYDQHRYQTVFCKHAGSIASPTAGLHFTTDLIEKLQAHAIGWQEVTLHVGAGTFLPVHCNDTSDHMMHAEYGELSLSTIKAIEQTHANNGRVIALGTTPLRILEAVAAANHGQLKPFQGDINLFIVPGFQFEIVDMLITNFHLPRSTLFMLVSAFSGLQSMQASYAYAIENAYRFYSYGDACLLRRNHCATPI